MRCFAPRKHTAPSLQPGLHRKTTFCFSAGITCRQTFKKRCSSQHSTPLSLQSTILSGRRSIHSGLTGQHVSLSFFSAPRPKNRGQPAKPIPLYFNYNSNPSISFAISFTALLAVQSVYSSAQATQWSYMNATRSPVSLILALISAIFSSSSFFNSF